MGGCLKMCGCDLPCGHTCANICHVLDRDHKEYKCQLPCPKFCPFDHPCPLRCWQGCKKCNVMVERVLKLCGHTVQMPCSTDTEEFKCYIQV